MRWLRISRFRAAATLAGSLLLVQAHAAAGEPGALTPGEKINYAIGAEIVRNYRTNGIEIDLDQVFRGMRDAASGKALLLSEKEMRSILIALQSDIRKKQSATKRSQGYAETEKGNGTSKKQ